MESPIKGERNELVRRRRIKRGAENVKMGGGIEPGNDEEVNLKRDEARSNLVSESKARDFFLPTSDSN